MSIDRLPLPAPDELTAVQKTAAERVASGPRGAVFGPFVPLLRAPELMNHVQAVGEYLRYESTLPRDVFEMAVLIVAREWDQDFEWTHHRPIAERAGLGEEAVAAIELGHAPSTLTPAQADGYAVVTQLLRTRSVGDEEWAAAVGRFGEAGVVELVTAVGYYTTLAMVMNAAGTPAPPDAGPLLPPRSTL